MKWLQCLTLQFSVAGVKFTSTCLTNPIYKMGAFQFLPGVEYIL